MQESDSISLYWQFLKWNISVNQMPECDSHGKVSSQKEALSMPNLIIDKQ